MGVSWVSAPCNAEVQAEEHSRQGPGLSPEEPEYKQVQHMHPASVVHCPRSDPGRGGFALVNDHR